MTESDLPFWSEMALSCEHDWARTDSDHVHLKVGYAAALEGSSLQSIIESRRPRILNDLVAYLREHPQSESTRPDR